MKNVFICFVLFIAGLLATYFAIPVLADLHRAPFAEDAAVVCSYTDDDAAVCLIRNRNCDYAEVQKVARALEREYERWKSTVTVQEDQEYVFYMPGYGGPQRMVFEVVEKQVEVEEPVEVEKPSRGGEAELV